MREAGEPDAKLTQQLENYVKNYGLEPVLYAMEICADSGGYDSQPSLDELRKYLRTAVGAVNRLKLEKQLL